MRITRDKLNKLAHIVADTLAEIAQVGFLEDRNTIRQEARKALERCSPRRRASIRPPGEDRQSQRRSSSKARRSGTSSTASTTTTKSASWASERQGTREQGTEKDARASLPQSSQSLMIHSKRQLVREASGVSQKFVA